MAGDAPSGGLPKSGVPVCKCTDRKPRVCRATQRSLLFLGRTNAEFPSCGIGRLKPVSRTVVRIG